MRDYESTFKALRCCRLTSERGCAECPFSLNSNEKCANLLPDAADAIEELLKCNGELENSGRALMAAFARLKEKVPQWISVEERLPKDSGYTIVFCADGDRRHVTFAKYLKTPKRWELNGARSYWRVLKWMPLPEPPKEVQDG